MEEKKIVDMLDENGVSILTRKFVNIDGKMEQVGKNHRIAYSNSESGRQKLQEEQPEDVVAAVLAMWGDEPTIVENDLQEELSENEYEMINM